MRITRLTVAFVLLLTIGLGAQNPPAPATITPHLDTPQARFIVATLQPRTPSIARTGHATNRVLMDRAKRTVVVADATKLGRVAFAEIAGIDRAHQLITNDGGDAEPLERLRAAGLAITIV